VASASGLSIFGNSFATKNWPVRHLFCLTLRQKYRYLHRTTRAPASGHPSWNFLLLNSNLLVVPMVTVKEHAACTLRVLQILGISVVFRQPCDFPTAAYEADWLAEPNQTYSKLNQPNLQNVTIQQVSSKFHFQNDKSSFFPIFTFISRNFANQMQMVLFPTLKILPKHIENCAIDVNILQIVNLTKTLLRMQRMKPTSINHVNTCSNFESCIGDLCSSLFYGEQADAHVNESHDILRSDPEIELSGPKLSHL
jgi:hypothetical protein